MDDPKRGEVFVFHYPKVPSIDYIKRVIGLPGDEVRYENKELFINGKSLKSIYKGSYIYEINDQQIMEAQEFIESLDEDSRYSCYTEGEDGFYSARQSLNLEASSEDEEDVKRKPLASPRGSRRSLAVRGVVNDDCDVSHSQR